MPIIELKHFLIFGEIFREIAVDKGISKRTLQRAFRRGISIPFASDLVATDHHTPVHKGQRGDRRLTLPVLSLRSTAVPSRGLSPDGHKESSQDTSAIPAGR